MSDTLCKLDRLRERDFDAYCRLVVPPRFVCEDCGRAAAKKKRLCEPKRIQVGDTPGGPAAPEGEGPTVP